MEVEGHAQGVGLFLLFQSVENIQKSENTVGEQSVPCGQGADAVKSAVDNAVSVQNHQFHWVRSLFRFFLYQIRFNTWFITPKTDKTAMMPRARDRLRLRV